MESPPVIKSDEEEEWRPVRVAKRRRNRIPMIRMSKNKKCVICGDVPTGYHYSVLACNGCKTFFRRTVITRRQFICSRGGKCEFSKEYRCSCRACRFRKCVEAGMVPRVPGSEEQEFELPLFSVESPVRMDELEQIRVLTVVAHTEKTLQSLRSKNLPLSFCPDYPLEELLGYQCNIGRKKPSKENNSVCETYKLNPVRYWMIVDLFLTVEFAKTFVEFQDLNSRDKSELLHSVGAPLQIFSQAYYSFAEKSDSVVFPDGTNALHHQVVRRNRPEHEAYYRNAYCRPVGIISQLGFTQDEIAMFKAIALFSSEGDLSQSSQEIVRKKREDLILIFRKHLFKEYGSQVGLEKLACALCAISTFIDIAEKRRAYVFCLDLTEKCNFPNLVQGIYLKRKVK